MPGTGERLKTTITANMLIVRAFPLSQGSGYEGPPAQAHLHLAPPRPGEAQRLRGLGQLRTRKVRRWPNPPFPGKLTAHIPLGKDQCLPGRLRLHRGSHCPLPALARPALPRSLSRASFSSPAEKGLCFHALNPELGSPHSQLGYWD